MILVLLAALLIPIVPFLVVGNLPGERWLPGADDSELTFGAVGAALLACDVLLPIPSSIIGSVLGARLGMATGAGWTLLGLCAGNFVGFGVGRLLPRRYSASLPATPSALVCFLSRPVPVLAEAVCFAAGATRMGPWSFAVACVTGNAAYALAMAANGAALLPDRFVGPGLILPMSVPVVAWLIWRRLSRSSS